MCDMMLCDDSPMSDRHTHTSTSVAWKLCRGMMEISTELIISLCEYKESKLLV